MRRYLLAAAAAAIPIGAQAQVKCVMPNGVSIIKQLGNCPHDAKAAYTLDGKPLGNPKDTKEGQAATAQIQASKEEAALQRNAKEDAEISTRLKQWDEQNKQLKAQHEAAKQKRSERVIYEACNVLKLPDHRCKIDVSLFKGNSVSVSTHLLPTNIDAICQAQASQIRKELMENRLGSGWIMRIKYSPTGAVIAECPI